MTSADLFKRAESQLCWGKKPGVDDYDAPKAVHRRRARARLKAQLPAEVAAADEARFYARLDADLAVYDASPEGQRDLAEVMP